MKSEGFPKKFCFRRWVEGPLEGMMDLSADAEAYKNRAGGILALGTGAALSFMLLLAGVLIINTWRIVFPFLSSSAVLPHNMPSVLSIIAITIIFLALAFFSTLILVQVWRYISVMLNRFENVEDFLGTPKTGPASQVPEKTMPGAGLFNILRASNSFTNDIVRNMPQVCRQIKFSRTVLLLMPVYYLGLRFGIPLIFGGAILEGLDAQDILFEIGLIALSIASIIAGLLVSETGRFLEVQYAGLKLLDSVRNAPMPKVPDGQTPAERLATYLEGGCKPAEGMDGYAVHLASEKCLVLAIETKTTPDIKLVKEFMEKCRKELKKLPKLPPEARFIILYTPEKAAEDIGEDVEKHILANPIILGQGPGGGNTETVVQIIIEESGTYGMFPFAE